VYSSWIAVARGSKAGLKAAAEVQRSRMAMRTIEDALTCTRMFVADAEYYSFEGESGSQAFISFVAALPQSFPRGGRFGDFNVRRVTFGLEPGPDRGAQLVLRQIPLLMDIDEDEELHPVVLAQNVKSFELEFFDQRAGEWLDAWTQTNQLPGLVKISLEYESREIGSEPSPGITRVVGIPSVAVPSIFQTGQPSRTPPGAPGVIRPGQNPVPTAQ
jgi:hypothetical protein